MRGPCRNRVSSLHSSCDLRTVTERHYNAHLSNTQISFIPSFVGHRWSASTWFGYLPIIALEDACQDANASFRSREMTRFAPPPNLVQYADRIRLMVPLRRLVRRRRRVWRRLIAVGGRFPIAAAAHATPSESEWQGRRSRSSRPRMPCSFYPPGAKRKPVAHAEASLVSTQYQGANGDTEAKIPSSASSVSRGSIHSGGPGLHRVTQLPCPSESRDPAGERPSGGSHPRPHGGRNRSGDRQVRALLTAAHVPASNPTVISRARLFQYQLGKVLVPITRDDFAHDVPGIH